MEQINAIKFEFRNRYQFRNFIDPPLIFECYSFQYVTNPKSLVLFLLFYKV